MSTDLHRLTLMKNRQFDYQDIRSSETELQSLIDMCGKPELSHGVRLLSMYVALYKKAYGELPRNSYEKILNSSIIDAELANVFENGMREAISILEMILRSQPVTATHNTKAVTLN